MPGRGHVKITLDLSKLVEEGKLSPVEAERLRRLAAKDTGPETALILGVVALAVGLTLVFRGKEQWSRFAQICLVAGALMFSGGVLAFGKGALTAMLIVTVALALASIVARSSLLMAAAVLALGACLGARTGYWHATYMLAIYEPLLTIVLFSLIALGTYHASKQLSADYERLALVAARTSVFMVNFGFWIGSLWGDRLLLIRSLLQGNPNIPTSYSEVIPPLPFVIGWTVALLGAGIWAVWENRRWMVNITAVFFGIDFYTQWFERLGLAPMSVFVGGLLMLAFALGLWAFNRRLAVSTGASRT
jgi:iron complex transport system permease protein